MEFITIARPLRPSWNNFLLLLLSMSMVYPSVALGQMPTLPKDTLIMPPPPNLTPTQGQPPTLLPGSLKIPPPPPNKINHSSSGLGGYTLGGGDNIRIDVFDLPQLSGQYQIPAGGNIQLPLIGSISIQGLTLEQAASAISNAYAPILKNPQITVGLLATRPLNIWIAGEVNRPGSYAVPLNSGAGTAPSVQFPTIVQAMEKASGVTQVADLRRIELRRRFGGQERTFKFDLMEYLKTGIVPAEMTLRDGDSIFVPTITQVDLAEARRLGTTTFSAPIDQPRNVAVIGEVFRPGNYVIQGGNTGPETGARIGLPTVTKAIQLAGGIKPIADIRQVQIRRLSKTGEQKFTVNLWQLLQNGDISQDTILQEGDTIIIPTATELTPAEVSQLAQASFAPTNVQVTVVGEVRGPGVLRMSPNTTLNQALRMAGWFTPSRAQSNFVELVRLNFDGTVTRRIISLDVREGLNEQTNPLMRDQDIIVVRRNGLAKFADDMNLVFSPVSGFQTSAGFLNAFFTVISRLGITKL
jgi:polysaccharide export outer membrane protein